MSQRLGRIIGTTVVVLCVIAFSMGIALLAKSYTMSAHVDEPKAQELTDRYEQQHFDMSPAERQQRASEIVNLRTTKWLLYNIGVCLCPTAATFAVGIARFRLWDMGNLKAATTPRTRGRLIALASAAWLAVIPGFLLGLHEDYAQDDLMPHNGYGAGGDSVMFLMMVAPFIIMIWMGSTLICRFFVLRNVNLPAALWYVDHDNTSRIGRLNIFYGAMICLLATFVALSMWYFKWGIPSGLIGIYVMLSSRAGLLSRNVQGS
jgi:hypothetical protein